LEITRGQQQPLGISRTPLLPLLLGRLLPILLASVGILWAGDLSAQSCPGGRISHIFINNESVFDTSEMSDGAKFLWFYNFANWVHSQTDEDFLAAELLFKEGDCLDEELLAESERLLRNLAFIASAMVFPIPQPDGTVHVVVNTRDEWTLQMNLRARFVEGIEFTGADITEENVLGRGIGVTGFWRQLREDKQVGGSIRSERFLGTRLDAGIRAGETRVGPFFAQNFFYPFVGEVGRFAALQSYSRSEDLFSYALESDPDFTHIVLPFRDERLEVTFAARLGQTGRLTVLGGGISYESLDFTGLNTGVEAVRDKNFTDREVAPGRYADLVASQMNALKVGRINVMFGQRLLRFTPRRGLDALRGVQDVATGLEVALILSKSLGILTPDSGDDLDDSFGRLRVFGGWAPGNFVFNSTFSLEGRRVSESNFILEPGWQDVFGEFDLVGYWKPNETSAHTVFARAAAGTGWNVGVPYQLTLGGSQGVRGYSVDRFAGGRRFLASLEERVYLGSPGGEALDVGMTVFGDIGRLWPGDVPFGQDSGWLASVGAGLRLGFPSGTRGVLRLDIATPANGPDAFSAITFRVSSSEILGLRSGFEDKQLARSRRSRIGRSILPNPASGR
jgi:hypothetical protein